MSGPDYPQDDQPVTPSKVPSLIQDYRAQREAWREQARNLARMREEVLSAADREAKDIVSAARTDIRGILLKARRDLLVLAAQVRAAGRLGEVADAPDSVGPDSVGPDSVNVLPADDLGQAHDVLTTARHDVRRVLDESRPELEGLASEGEALRAALRPQRVVGPVPIEQRRQLATPTPPNTIAANTIEAEPARPVDFEFTSLNAEDTPDLVINRGRVRPIRAVLTVAASVGALAVMGTALWLYGPLSTSSAPRTDSKAASDSKAAESKASTTKTSARPSKPAPPVTAAVNAAATSTKTTSPASAPVPESRPQAGGSRAPLSIQLVVRRTAWMRVTTDGRIAAERTFKPGETQQVSAAREISVRAGDAGAVTVAVDGRQPVALGREGEVVTRRFAVDAPRVQPAAPPAAALPSAAQPAPAPPAAPNPSVPIARQAAPEKPVVPSSATPVSTASTTVPAPRAIEPPAVSTPPAASSTLAAAPARPPAASPDRPASASTPAPATPASLQESLTNQVSRWQDAYYRQDRAMLSAIAPQASVADDRGDKERLPAGMNGVRRSLEDVSFRVFGSEAMLTARMTERMDNGAAGQMAQAVSFISHMWSQHNGTWQLHDVRIVSASALSRAITR